MKIDTVNKFQIFKQRKSFKGNSANSSPFSNFPSYQSIPLNGSKAYISTQINQSYRALETFDVPYVGQGKLYELSNGHKIAIVKKNGPTVINTFVKVGRNESLVESHLLEHLLYEPHNDIESKSYFDFFIKNGIKRRAETWDNYTNYYMQYPFNDSKEIDNLIKIQANLLQNSNITNDNFETQKNVIFAEYTRRSFKNDAEKIDRLFVNTLLNEDKRLDSYNFSKESIDNITLNELIDFHKKYYQNNNMISVVVGDVNPDEVLQSFAKYFYKLNTIPPQIETTPKKLLQRSLEVMPNQVGQKNILQIGFIGPQRNNLKDCFLESAFSIYVNYISSKPQDINIQKHYIVNGREPVSNTGILFVAEFEAGKEKEAKEEVNKYLHELVEEPLSDSDIAIIKTRLKDSLSNDAESALQTSYNIGESLSEGNSMIDLDKYKFIDSLTTKDFQDFAKKYINFNNQLTMAFVNPQTNNTASPSFKSNINEINTDNISESTLPNNLKLVVDTSPEIKRTTFSLTFKTIKQKNNNNQDLPIILQKMMAIASPLNSKFLKENDGGVEIQSDSNYLKIIVNTHPEDTIQAISTVENIFLHPILNQKCFNYVKKQYPNNFNWDNVQLSDIVNYYNELISYSQGKAILTIPKEIYDKNQKEIINILTMNIPNLRKVEKLGKISPSDFIPFDKKEIKLKEIEGDNAIISQDFKIPDIDYADTKTKINFLLLKTILSKQLFKELVENQGISYVVGVYDKKGQLEVLVETPASKEDSSNIKKVLDTTQVKIDNLINNPISEDEFNDIKKCLKGNYINSIETSKGKNSLLYTYDISEVESLFKSIDDITPLDIQSTAKEYLSKPSHIIIRANKDIINANK